MRKESRRLWEVRQESGANSLDLYIYSDVEEDSYNWWGELQRSATSANFFKEELEKHSGVTQINIYINSRGGSVFEGTAIYNQLRRHPAHKTVYIDGFACSIASVIAMAGDEIVMPKNAMMMIHNMWMVAMGNPRELRKAADDLEVINEAGRQAYLVKAGDKLDETELVAMMDAETWLTAESCLRLGLADRYADYDADMSGALETLQQANLTLSQRISYHRALAAQLNQLLAEWEDCVLYRVYDGDGEGPGKAKAAWALGSMRPQEAAAKRVPAEDEKPSDATTQAARDAPLDSPIEPNKILQLFAKKGV